MTNRKIYVDNMLQPHMYVHFEGGEVMACVQAPSQLFLNCREALKTKPDSSRDVAISLVVASLLLATAPQECFQACTPGAGGCIRGCTWWAWPGRALVCIMV